MKHHPHFTKKRTIINNDPVDYFEIMRKYENGELRIVGYDLKVGDIALEGYDKASMPIYRTVTEIKEEHKSGGDFKNYDRPQSYRVAV